MVAEAQRLGSLPVLLLKSRAIKLVQKSRDKYENKYVETELFLCELLLLEGHANIVKVYAIHDWGDTWAIEMERLYKHDQYPDPGRSVLQNARICDDKKAAKEYLSSLGYEHTDLHHNNWMEDSKGVVKMIDFDRVYEPRLGHRW